MTPEKLSELEKLEAAVTPGEWRHLMLRADVRDLFAALREAWREIEIRDLRLQAYAERDEVRPDLLTQLEEKTDQLWAVEKERDEVRAALRMLWEEFGRSTLVSTETRAAVKAALGEIP